MPLTSEERDTLTALIKSGLLRGGAAFEKLGNRRWDLVYSEVRPTLPSRLADELDPGTEELFLGRLLPSAGAPLEVCALFPGDSVRGLVERLSLADGARRAGVADLPALTIAELTNIVGHRLVTALADELRSCFLLAPAELRTGPTAELLAELARRYRGEQHLLLRASVELYSGALEARCGLLVALRQEPIGKLLRGRC